MSQKPATNAAIATLVGVVAVTLGLPRGHLRADDPPKKIPAEIVIRQEALPELRAELARRITSAPARVMKNSGLAGAVGGSRVRVLSGDPQEILLPIPQVAGGQVPLCYFISSHPADAVTEFRLRKRPDGNVFVAVRLVGKKQEVQLEWSAIVLLSPRAITANTTPADPYRKPTSCVQSDAEAITKLATTLWPNTGKTDEFAAAIQRHIREMKRTERPRSLDALGILQSGENSICTANANLAAALMRSKGIACRSVAVIPPISQKLEMHRIVEYLEKDQWLPFDPSSLQADIPTRPWQNIIMARTSTADEQVAMKPRMGVMVGCPYGQEIELLTPGVTLFGQDFFWTMARPLAEFEPTEEATRLAAKAWARYLESGTLTQAQRRAGSAESATEFIERLKSK